MDVHDIGSGRRDLGMDPPQSLQSLLAHHRDSRLGLALRGHAADLKACNGDEVPTPNDEMGDTSRHQRLSERREEEDPHGPNSCHDVRGAATYHIDSMFASYSL